ncbi:MAG: cell division protein ZapA, partial [Pseudomonadota bacterium]
RLLLMAGLLLADKSAGSEDKVKSIERKVGALQAELEEAREAALNPATVEVARIPSEVTDTLAELAARAEAVADAVEDQVNSG